MEHAGTKENVGRSWKMVGTKLRKMLEKRMEKVGEPMQHPLNSMAKKSP